MKTRACWSALESRAEQKITQLRAETAQAEQLRDALLASQLRLENLYEEYRAQAEARETSKGMSDAMNQRQFMSQLLKLRERVERDIETSNLRLQTLTHRMLQAETERLKMKTLAENDRLAVQKFVQKREQNSMDELGMLQFNQARPV
ncbi:MAG: flagellar export protein FliJ [Rhodoferax sp.]|jgi:flagellar export protein FliJ|nr:flagellar export protein FliJ [Rhodoferax sp.]